MAKAFAIISLLLGLCLALLCGLDLGMGIPFHQSSPILDYGLLVCSVVIVVLSWLSFREQP